MATKKKTTKAKNRKKVKIKQSPWIDVEPVYVPAYKQPGGTGYTQPLQQVFGEEVEPHVMFTYGRFNPPTTGHELVINKIKEDAAKQNATPMVITSHSHDHNRNPLDVNYKMGLLHKAFGDVVHPEPQKSLVDAFKLLESKGFKKATIYVGDDRLKEVNRCITGTNGKDYNIPDIKIALAGTRDSSYNTSGVSATKVREAAKNNKVDEVRSMLPDAIKDQAEAIVERINNVSK